MKLKRQSHAIVGDCVVESAENHGTLLAIDFNVGSSHSSARGGVQVDERVHLQGAYALLAIIQVGDANHSISPDVGGVVFH